MKKTQFYWIILLLVFPLHLFAQGVPVTKKKRKYGFRPELVRGPYLQMATPNSMMLRWRTDEPDFTQVRYCTELDRLDKITGDKALVREHRLTLRDLKPDTKYFYLIEGAKDTLQGDSSNYFLTLPIAGQQGLYRIGVFGDCGNNSTNQRSTRDQFEKYLGNQPLRAWILLGDNAYSFGKDNEYQSNFFNIYKDNLLKKSPLFPAPGNHDYHDEPFSATYAQKSNEVAYYQNFSMPEKGESGGLASNTAAFYSFDIGNIHFLSLDSHGMEENNSRLFDTLGTQVQWVKKDLEANKNKEWVVAYWHHPPYSMGSHNSDTEDQMVKIRENFIQILERYGVDVVLCGHSHSYERSELMKGHYGMEKSFNPKQHNVMYGKKTYDAGKATSAYSKDRSNTGTVYVLSGSAGQLGGSQTSYPHDAMQFSDVTHGGSCILEVQGNKFVLKWICADGLIRDQFSIVKPKK